MKEACVESPRLSAEILISHALNISKLELFISLDKKVSKESFLKILSLIKRRAIGEPVAYIVQKKEFYGREFFVNKDVLIPRPETETIIDVLKTIFDKDRNFLFVDIGTGCGNIAVTVACEFLNSFGIATDISKKAILVAKTNALKWSVKDRIVFINTDIASGLKQGSIDVVLSNPPYVGRRDFLFLQREVRCFEPYRAIVGGYYGWEIYPKLFAQVQFLLKKGGIMLVEIDESFKDKLKEILGSCGVWKEVCFFKDLAKRDRVLYAKK